MRETHRVPEALELLKKVSKSPGSSWFVGTYDTLADFYTKALDFKTFERLRALIMNIPADDARIAADRHSAPPPCVSDLGQAARTDGGEFPAGLAPNAGRARRDAVCSVDLPS